MTPTAYTLKIIFDCPHCRTGVPVNGFTEEVLCDTCLKTTELNEEWWEEHVTSEMAEEALAAEPGYGTSTTSLGGMSEHIEMGNRAPRCQNCKQEFTTETMQAGVNSGHFSCPGCSNKIRVRQATELAKLIVPEADLLVHEDETGEKLAEYGQPAAKPVMFSCLSCGGALKVDGKSRTVSCTQCNNDNYLPDALWLRLHPAKVSHAFFVTIKTGNIQVDQKRLLDNLNQEKAMKLLKDSTVKADVLHRIFNEIEDEDDVLERLAKHPNADDDLLVKLCNSGIYYQVRVAVAKREKLPAKVIEALAEDDDSDVRAALMKRPEIFTLPEDILRSILRDIDLSDLGGVLKHKDFPEWKLYEMADNCTPSDAERILRSPNVTKRVLRRLGSNPDSRPIIRKHPLYIGLSWWQKLFFFPG